MAEVPTTSSKTLSKDPIPLKSSLVRAKTSEVQIVNRLAKSLNESYQNVKQKQQLYKQISSAEHMKSTKRRKVLNPVSENKENHASEEGNLEEISSENQTEWQEVIHNKNKLKRKKKLSASLTSVSDSVNQEKRTRIEGIQLNCRGRLQIREDAEGNLEVSTHQGATNRIPLQASVKTETQKVTAKPPIPPSHPKNLTDRNTSTLPPPPRLKRKLIENVQTIQKLNTLAENLRLEINELKSSLSTERGAVRVLRAQNECESRKWKSDVKKLQLQIDMMRKGVLANARKNLESSSNGLADGTVLTSATGLVNYEIQRLTNEINILRDANKTLEEKNLINYDADRRKTADIRELRDSYENRLTQIQKSAKIEISRLLEEIKTKERNIGQLKKDLQILQNPSSASRAPNKRALAATTKGSKPSPTTNDLIKLTPQTNLTKPTNKKPKKSLTLTNSSNGPSTSAKTTKTQDLEKKSDQNSNDGGSVAAMPSQDSTPEQITNEITQLRDIELIKNTKNLKGSTNTNTNGVTLLTQQQNNILQSLENAENHKKNSLSNLLTTTKTSEGKIITTTTRTLCGSCQKEYYTMPPEMNEDYLSDSPANEKSSPVSNKTTRTMSSGELMLEKPSNDSHCNDLSIYRSKDSNSDSDSALSSAPPSISPQPPANGLEPNDIWQTIRSYSQDAERLQKEVDSLQKENERLQKELNLAKEQIIESEKTAIEATKQNNVQQYLERIRFLEEQEHHLQNECSELREQNELLEFRILELEETNDKWSLQSHVPPTSATNANAASHTNALNNATKDLWSNSSGSSSSSSGNSSHCSSNSSNKSKLDPMHLLFGNRNANNCLSDSGITSPHSQLHTEDDFHLIDVTNEELCRRLSSMMRKTSLLDDDDKQYLQQVIALVQHYDLISQRTSGPASLNTSCSSSDEPSSLEMAKSRISDYSSASSSSTSSSSSSSSCDKNSSKTSTSKAFALPSSAGFESSSTAAVSSSPAASSSPSSRIVATVQPYNSSSNHQTGLIVPTNTPNDSPKKLRTTSWQCSSLSESGVFVEDNDCLDSSQISEQSSSTQAEFLEEDLSFGKPYQQKLQRYHSSPLTRLSHQTNCSVSSPYLSEQKHLQFYKDRLELLESKILIYESSGDIQAKRLADRLQKEVQLEKQLRELQERVEFLENENLNLEEEKCEFEEAENDTRLRLQRLEIDLEILSQRNVELELSKEALSAKYKDCRSECMILREDLEACERQVQLIDEDKVKAKKDFEFLHSLIPLFCCYSAVQVTNLYKEQQELSKSHSENDSEVKTLEMGNIPSNSNLTGASMVMKSSSKTPRNKSNQSLNMAIASCPSCGQDPQQISHLREENIALRLRMNEMKCHHFAALETADNQWVDLEKGFKQREEAYKINEQCLKQKIAKLQECLREDSRAANEKIQQLEESEESLKVCLVRLSKEHRDLFEKYKTLCEDLDHFKDDNETLRKETAVSIENMEAQKRRCKELQDELNFMRRLQRESESRTKLDEDTMRNELSELKKQILHSDVTNSELKEEVATLEDELYKKSQLLNEIQSKLVEVFDELRTKEDIIEKLEYNNKNNFRSSANSLAQELKDPIKAPASANGSTSDGESRTNDDLTPRSGRSSQSKTPDSPKIKKVSIEDVEYESDNMKSGNTSISGASPKKRFSIASILKKSSPRTMALGEESTQKEPPVVESQIEEVPFSIKEDEVTDLQTARKALDGAIKNFERSSSDIPKLILTDITRI